MLTPSNFLFRELDDVDDDNAYGVDVLDELNKISVLINIHVSYKNTCK